MTSPAQRRLELALSSLIFSKTELTSSSPISPVPHFTGKSDALRHVSATKHFLVVASTGVMGMDFYIRRSRMPIFWLIYSTGTTVSHFTLFSSLLLRLSPGTPSLEGDLMSSISDSTKLSSCQLQKPEFSGTSLKVSHDCVRSVTAFESDTAVGCPVLTRVWLSSSASAGGICVSILALGSSLFLGASAWISC